MEEAKDGGAGGGASDKPQDKQPPAAEPPAPKEEGSETDEFGYEKVPSEEKPEDKKGSDKEETPVEKPEGPVAGYGNEPPKVDDAPPAPVDDKKVDPPAPDELDKVFAELPKEDQKMMKDLAVKHKLTPEVAKDFADARRKEIADAVEHSKQMKATRERQAQQMRADWHKELKEDSTFGGDNYTKSLHTVDRVLTEFMSDTKKKLTETGGMLPPYVMRGLANLGKHLYATDKLNTEGDALGSKSKDDDKVDPLDFYNKPGE
jgi:hypothetical protein